MSFQAKITTGFLLMLALLLAIGGYALFIVNQLNRNARTTLQANVYSVELGQRMLRALDIIDHNTLDAPEAQTALTAFRRELTREAGNITEPGESALVDSLTQALARLDQYAHAGGQEGGGPDVAPAGLLDGLRGQTQRMMSLNVTGMSQKVVRADRETTTANRLLLAGITVAVLLASLLVFSVPAAAVAPLQLLQASIRHATERDFSQAIPVESRDEFGAVARDFNHLLSELNEFRASTSAELLTERNRLAAVINTLEEGLLLVDANRTILLANPVAAALLGVPAKELIGRPAAAVAAENDLLRAVLRPLDSPDRVAAAAEAQPLLTITQPGHDEAYYRLTAHDIVSFNDVRDQLEFVGYILALHNVSSFKKLDQVKSNFLATVSHELKTPLSSIGLSLKILQDARVPAEEREQLITGLRQETQRLQRLVSELLDIARLESGNIPLDFRAVAIPDLVEIATTPVQAQLAQKHLTLTPHLPSDLPAVRADAEKTSWVLLNLLVNAIRYSPEGGTIHLRAHLDPVSTAADNVRFIRFTVQDEGPGIAPENHERVFQRFHQVPDHAGALGAYRGGSGLGLSIAREFIQAQGGRIGVESELGAGARFWFTLPVAG